MRNIGQLVVLVSLFAVGYAAVGQVSLSILNGKPEKPVVGLPLIADQSVRTVQHLANGMPLTHEMKGHIYRSADGVERYDGAVASTDPANPEPITMVYILDRVKRTAVLLNSKLMTATVQNLPDNATITISFLPLQIAPAARQIKPENVTTVDLGKRMQNQMEVQGKRVTGTIPAGKIGNDQPLLITTEGWVSVQEKLVVKEVEQNPLSGERTFELTNIRGVEPDPALFQIPDGYTVKERAAMPAGIPQLGAPKPPEQRTKQIEDALKSTDPGVKNDVAYGLAVNRDHLADAQLLTEQAVQLKEQQVADIVSGGDPAKSFDQMVYLSRFWDTAGYVYYRALKQEKAEAYLRAAWALNPNSIFALHLGFVYEAEHKQAEATAIYRMALSAKPSPAVLDEITTRLSALGQQDAQSIPVDIATPLPTLNLQPGTNDEEPVADIVLSHNHLPSITLLKGKSALKKPLTQAIETALTNFLPDDGPELVIRRAGVTCSAGDTASCELHFTNTREFTAAEQARRDALQPPLP